MEISKIYFCSLSNETVQTLIKCCLIWVFHCLSKYMFIIIQNEKGYSRICQVNSSVKQVFLFVSFLTERYRKKSFSYEMGHILFKDMLGLQ